MNVAFVTLFLGLVAGRQEVQVAVGSTVSAVEIRLDGVLAAEATAPQWKGPIDFGKYILPHELEAIAFDRQEREVGRAQIWVNLPRSPAEAAFVVERPDQTGRQIARLTWESTRSAAPRAVRVTLDGEPLDVEDLSHFEIPPSEPGRVRILRADLRFGDNISAAAEAFVGGMDRDYASAELTAVPVVLTDREALPPVSELSGWFVRDGEPLHVVAAEEGPADIVFLVDPQADPVLGQIDRKKSRYFAFRSRNDFQLPEESFGYFVIPAPSKTGDSPYAGFPMAGPATRADGGFVRLYSVAVEGVSGRDPQYLPRAAQITGLGAIWNGRRRAVVWVLSSPSPRDAASLEPARRYLTALNVPLFVWRVSSGSPRSKPAPGELDASTPANLDKAISGLSKALSRQRIVWVEGRHLPQSIALSVQAAGIEIAR